MLLWYKLKIKAVLLSREFAGSESSITEYARVLSLVVVLPGFV